jgi:hypothetical protein
MGANFSVWLRETGRLYLRYMAVGVASIPFAAGAIFAKQAGWNERIALPILLSLGVISASLVWKWMGDWQIQPDVSIREPEWANFLSVGGGAALMVRSASRARVAWAEALAPIDSDSLRLQWVTDPVQLRQYPSISGIFQGWTYDSGTQSAHALGGEKATEPSHTRGQSAPPPPLGARQPLTTQLQG